MKPFLLVLGLLPAFCAVAQTNYQFDFSGGPAPAGWIAVSPTNGYSAAAGFGFEPGAKLVPAGPATAAITSQQPFLFSVRVSPGNYRVTATLAAGSVTTIKAEQRRLMVEHARPVPGQPVTFIVNVRTPAMADGQKVNLKKRELETETVNWDEKLTLEFNGVQPGLTQLTLAPVTVPTVFITGDSTVCDQPAEPWNSWGQMLPRFFRPEVAVANYAESGESIKSSLRAHRFDKVFSLLQSGDYLLVQFGHNDQKDKSTNALADYRANLEKIIIRTRVLGGTPVLVTSMERKGGLEQDTLASYPDTVRAVAQAEHCALIDLNAMSRVFYRALGTNLDLAFQDGTHHNNYGSYELAKCVVAGIQQAKLPLARSICPDFPGFDPAKPDDVATFTMPASPVVSADKPLGN